MDSFICAFAALVRLSVKQPLAGGSYAEQRYWCTLAV